MLFNKNLLKVMLACFLAEPVFDNVCIGSMVLMYRLVGFKPVSVSMYSVGGCIPLNWMSPVTTFGVYAITFSIGFVGFLLSRKGFKQQNINFLIVGAFLFYRGARFLALGTIGIYNSNPLWFIGRKDFFESKPLSFFGNFYTLKWTEFLIHYSIIVFFMVLAFIVVLRHWDKLLRLQFFTFGLIAWALGGYCWYYLVGPHLY